MINYVIVDLEATCWENNKDHHMEIIEIGAIILDENFEAIDEYQSFVKPIVNPILSDFCKTLTNISQADVDSAPLFPEALQGLLNRINQPVILCSWGKYDENQLIQDLELHHIPYYEFWSYHFNLKNIFADVKSCKRCGVAKALAKLNIPFEGTHHRGIDDARMIHCIADSILKPKILETTLSILS